jgi:hypothetical protein
MRLDVATVLLQWSAGGLLGCWITTRRREVGLGYGWLLRSTYLVLAAGAFVAGLADVDSGTGAVLRDAASLGVAAAAAVALIASIIRRRAGVRGQEAVREQRRERVAKMLERGEGGGGADERSHEYRGSGEHGSTAPAKASAEFNPALDLVAPVVGFVGLLGAASAVGGPYPLSLVRLVAGALLLGLVTDAMLLGHWYLVQPGLARDPIRELVKLVAWVWPIEVIALVWPVGMAQVIDGTIDDGWAGLLGWTWAVSAVTTIGLVGATWFALKERSYSAVMAATGLLYLAILTAFGADLIARAVLAP